jgi:hypothetical protein
VSRPLPAALGIQCKTWRFDPAIGVYVHPALSERLRRFARATVGKHFKVPKERRHSVAVRVGDLDDWEIGRIEGTPLEDHLIGMLRTSYDLGLPIDHAELRMEIPTNLGFNRSAMWYDPRWH